MNFSLKCALDNLKQEGNFEGAADSAGGEMSGIQTFTEPKPDDLVYVCTVHPFCSERPNEPHFYEWAKWKDAKRPEWEKCASQFCWWPKDTVTL